MAFAEYGLYVHALALGHYDYLSLHGPSAVTKALESSFVLLDVCKYGHHSVLGASDSSTGTGRLHEFLVQSICFWDLLQ